MHLSEEDDSLCFIQDKLQLLIVSRKNMCFFLENLKSGSRSYTGLHYIHKIQYKQLHGDSRRI